MMRNVFSSDNGFVPSGNKLSLEPTVPQISVAIYMGSLYGVNWTQ